MARKSIFDIVSESINMETEAKRIITMAEDEYVLSLNYSDQKLFDFVDNYCFSDWEHRGHFIDVDDYLEALDFKTLKKNAAHDDDVP